VNIHTFPSILLRAGFDLANMRTMGQARSVGLGLLALAASAAAIAQTTPDQVGLDVRKLEAMMGRLKAEVDAGRLPGASVVILRGGKLAYESSVGWRDKEFRGPMTSDTICRLMSMVRAQDQDPLPFAAG
jgi:CubicO group peptidase (beta-lactamase class C family)